MIQQQARTNVASRPMRFLGRISHSCALLLTVSALLLLLGFYRLSLFLTEGLINSMYGAMVLLLIYNLAVAISFGLLETRFVNSFVFSQKWKTDIRLRISHLLGVCMLFFWLKIVCDEFGVTERVWQLLGSALDFGIAAGQFRWSIKSTLGIVAALYIGVKVSKGLQLVLTEDVYPRYNLDLGVRHSANKIVQYLCVALFVFFALSISGIDLSSLAIIAGALSVGIGFGLQNIANNIVSGFILLFERPVKLGDLVSFSGTLGTVSRIGFRSSTIRGLDDVEIIVPNSVLVTEAVTNLTHSSTRIRISVTVGVAYGTDTAHCIRILAEAAASVSGVLSYPPPSVLLKDFADSALVFEVRAWITQASLRDDFSSVLRLALRDRLLKENIVIPFPQRDIHIVATAG